VSLPSFDSSVNNCLVLSAQGPNPQSFRRPSVWPFALAPAPCGFRENEDGSIGYFVLPDLDALIGRAYHGAAIRNLEGVGKLRQIAEGPVDPEFPRAVRIYL
jgi:hypothetical protein